MKPLHEIHSQPATISYAVAGAEATGLVVNGEALEDLITRVVRTVTGGTGK